jgi:CRISPR-associated protein Csd2
MKMSLTNKIDFAVVFNVKNANPNGDPLNGNRPRTNYDRVGEVSDVCIKRKIRDRLQEAGVPIFVQSDDKRQDDYRSLRSRAEGELDKNLPERKFKSAACEKWFDVRAFGQLFAYGGKKKDKKKKDDSEESSSDKGVSIGIRGPVSVHPAFSIDKINISSEQIVKSVNAEGDDGKPSPDRMGMKHRVDEGVYVFCGSMNPQLATKTGFSDEDALAIKNMLPKLFENDASSARPEGSMEVLKVVWWQHNCPHGQYSSAKVHRSLSVNFDGSFDSNLLNSLDGLKPELIDGF